MRRIAMRKSCAVMLAGLLAAGAGAPFTHAQGSVTPIEVRLHLTEAGEVEIRWEMQTFHLPIMMLQAEAIAARGSSAGSTSTKRTSSETTSASKASPLKAAPVENSPPKTSPAEPAPPKPAPPKPAPPKPAPPKPAPPKPSATTAAATIPAEPRAETPKSETEKTAPPKGAAAMVGTASGGILSGSGRVGSSGKTDAQSAPADLSLELERDIREELDNAPSDAEATRAERDDDIFDHNLGKDDEPAKSPSDAEATRAERGDDIFEHDVGNDKEPSNGNGALVEVVDSLDDLRVGSDGKKPGGNQLQTAMELSKQLPDHRRRSESAVRQMLNGKVWGDGWKSKINNGMRPKQMTAKIVKTRNFGMNSFIPEGEVPRPILTQGAGGRYYTGAYTDRKVDNGSTYAYQVQLYDAAGNKIGQSEFTAIEVHDGLRPDAVPGIELHTANDTSIWINWQPVNDPEVIGYKIYRIPTGPAEGSIGSRGEFVASNKNSGASSTGSDPKRTTTPAPKTPFANAAMTTKASGAEAQAAVGSGSAAMDRAGGGALDITDSLGSDVRHGGRMGPGDLQAEAIVNANLAMKFSDMQAWKASPAIQMAVSNSYLLNPGIYLREPLALVPADATSYVDHAADPKTAYDYRVVAYDTHSGDGAFGQPHVAQLPDREPPKAAKSVSASAGDGGLVTFQWQPSPSSDVSSYRLFRRTDGGTPVPIRIVDSGVRQAEDRLDPYSPSNFGYVVYAYDAAGNASPAVESSGVRLPDIRPPAPPAITAIDVGDASVDLSWTAPPDPDVDHFRVFRQKLGTTAETLTGNLKARRFTDRTGKLGAKYVYWVTAVDGRGNESAPSKAFEQRFVGTVDAVPPTSVQLIDKSGQRTVQWNKDIQADGTTYLVLRSSDASGEFTPISGALYGTSFVDRSAQGREYFYRVVARYYTGDVSNPSPTVSSGGGIFKTGGK